MSPNEQSSVCAGAAPVIEHDPGPAYAGLIDQLTPFPPGSGSLSVTDFAVPVPGAPEFDTVTENPIGSPVFTGVASATLAIDRCGASTTIVAEAFTEGWLVAAAVAVFGYAPALAAVVAL